MDQTQETSLEKQLQTTRAGYMNCGAEGFPRAERILNRHAVHV